MPGWRCFHRKFCPIVPFKFRKTIFDNFHSAAHLGRLNSHCINSSRFVWRGLYRDITAWAHGCLARQWGKIHRHTCLVPKLVPILLSYSCFKNVCGGMRKSFNFYLDFTFRSARNNHF
jgi:hypothetical protein